MSCRVSRHSRQSFLLNSLLKQPQITLRNHADCRNALGPMTNFSPGISEAAYAEVSLIGRIRRTFHMQKFRRSMHLHQWPPMHGLLNRQHCGHHDIVMQIYIYICIATLGSILVSHAVGVMVFIRTRNNHHDSPHAGRSYNALLSQYV